ncbi:MAG: ABC transporter permease subunit [Anaerolineae bacterium]|nr:ABC transporter permease subunit [Anaerolineae bacterium]
MLDRIRTIIDKEWHQVFKNKLVLIVAIVLPLTFVALPLWTLSLLDDTPEEESDELLPGWQANPAYAGLTDSEIVQAVVVEGFQVFFLIIPLALPVSIAAYSIVGEKTTKSLEPLLATPISVAELLIGKGLAAAIPAVGATWISYLVYAIIARFLTNDPVYSIIVSPAWILIILVLTPLLCILGISAGIIVSSRVNDPRAAEQLGSLIMLPVLALYGVQFAGWVSINMATFLIGVVISVLIDAVVLWVAVKLFQRETILTRWS